MGIKVSVCIVTYKSNSLLKKCLKSLSHQTNSPKFELVIVNNDPNDNTPDIILNEFQHLKCLRKIICVNSKNNIATARALAANKSKGEYIVYTDPDCLLPNNWLSLHLSNFLAAKQIDSRITATGSCFEVPHNGDFFLKLIGALYKNSFAQLKSPQGLHPDNSIYVDHIPTLNAFYQRSAINELGSFDPFFNYVCEDVDLGFRNIEHGHRNQMFASPSVQHCITNNLKDWISRCLKYGMGQSYVISKHKRAQLRHFFVFLYTALLILTPFYLDSALIGFTWLCYFLTLILKLNWDFVRGKIEIDLALGLIPIILITHFFYGLGFAYGFLKYLFIIVGGNRYEYSSQH